MRLVCTQRNGLSVAYLKRAAVVWLLTCLAVFWNVGDAAFLLAQNAELAQVARASLLRASDYFVSNVSNHGGYVYYVSEDLQGRWGESAATDEMIYVQPPATPTVGEALLAAYEVTGEPRLLDAARAAGHALVSGQLKSGGWDQVIHFAPPRSGRMGNYRTRAGGKWTNSSLDDD